MEITYDYYRVFYYVAKYKSFSRAAGVLLSNQPNITKFMNNLEGQLGCKLFVRSNRGVTLTPEGEKLYARVSVAYEQLKAAELELASDKTLQGGIVTMGVSETALHGVLLPVLTKFHAAYPGVRICLSSHSTPQALQALKNGVVDFSIVTTPYRIQKPFRETTLKAFREILIGSRQYAALAQQPRHLEELTPYPFICLGKETVTYAFYSQLFLAHGLTLQPDTEAATADQLLPIIRHDLGIGFIPEFFTREAIKSGEIVEIPVVEEIPSRAICLVEDTTRPLSIAADALKQLLIKETARG